MTRKFSSISVETTLASGISNSATSMTVATGTGSALLGGVTLAAGNVDQFTVALDPDTQNEEIVFITAVSSDTFTIVRGCAGTSAISHSGGAAVKHVLTSDDLNAFTTAISPVSSITFSGSSSGTMTLQGAAISSGTVTLPAGTATLVSTTATQTLTNKTLTSPTVTGASISTSTFTTSINAQTGTTYTLVLADNSKLVTLDNGSGIIVTVPTNASVAFPTGSVINLAQLGAGQVTISGDTGVTVSATPGTKLRTQYSGGALIKTGTDSWLLLGDLSA